MTQGLIVHMLRATCLVLSAWGAAPVPADEKPPEVEIRGADGTVLIASKEIRSYEWAGHILTLEPQALEALQERLPINRIVSGIPFAVTVDGETIYTGNFTTSASSKSFKTPVIRSAPFPPGRLAAEELQIQLGYPTADFFEGKDPRSDGRIRAALKAQGKLIEGKSEHSRWLARSLREMQSIKAGMTRAELLEVFQNEGGLSNRTQQRFSYRDSPHIKVDVRFEPVGQLDDKLLKVPEDKITSISTPFLEWPILD